MIADLESAERAVESALSRLQVDLVGVAAVEDWADTPLGEAAQRMLPGAKSIIVTANEVYSEVLVHSTPEKTVGEAALRDILAPHFGYLDGRLTKAVYDISQAARRQGLRALPVPAVGCPNDPRYLRAVLSLKHAAQAAGLGTIGKSSLLINPRFGPRMRLSCALTEARLTPSKATAQNPCVDCGLCIEACPAGALAEPSGDQPYAINKFACSAFRTGSGACSECMRVCPISG